MHAHEAALPWQWTQCRLAETHLLVAWRAHPRVHEHAALNPRQCSQWLIWLVHSVITRGHP